MTRAEERLAANIERMSLEIFRLRRAQQELCAFLDSLAKILLTCVPEPGEEAMEPASRGYEAGTRAC